jgi:hypothetical protein
VLAFDVEEQVKIFYTPGKGLTLYHKESQLVINPDSSITIEHKGGESIVELIGDTINIVSASQVNVTTQKVVVDHSDVVELGAGAAEKLVLGDSFLKLFNQHTHIGNSGAPTSPPIQPMTPLSHLSGKGGNPVVKTV